jgi:hypothetical protein
LEIGRVLSGRERSEMRDGLPIVPTPPHAVSEPKRRVEVAWACRPGGVDELVVKLLLHVVNEALLKVALV